MTALAIIIIMSKGVLALVDTGKEENQFNGVLT